MKLKKNPKPQYCKYGNIIETVYIDNHVGLHRIDGPAIVRYNKETKELLEECYYINGKEYDEFKYWVIIASLNV